MKFNKIITTCLFTIGLTLCSCSTTDINSNGGDNSQGDNSSQTHVHTFSSEWSHDETHHWHAATCEHTSEIKDKSEHTFDSWVIDNQATEENEGSRHKICKICQYRIDETIPVVDHVHNWNNPTYTWSYDNATCTAKRTCLINLYHIEEETANSTYSVIVEPTTESVGVGRYTAAFQNSTFETQYKDITIPKTNVPVSGISLNKDTLELSVGGYSTLLATVSPYNASNTSVEWTTSNNLVATVTSSGLVTGVGDGEAVITATTVDGGYTATCNVTVTHIAVTGVSLGTTSMTLEEGEISDAIYASVTPYTATNTDVTWSIDNNNVATISTTIMGGCKVTAVQAGTATVTATTVDGGFTATCSVKVIEQKNFSYQIGDTVVAIYQYTTSYSSSVRAKVYTPVTNNGNVNIYIGSCSVDIEDSNGNLKQSVDYMSCHPDIIRPGETTYIYDDVSYTGDTTTGLVGVPHITIKDASTADGTRYDVSNVSFVTDSIFGFTATGTVTNNNNETSSLIVVAILIFDNSGNYYTTLFTYVYDSLASGAISDFSASNTDLMYRKTEFTKDDIGSYEAYACEQEYIF